MSITQYEMDHLKEGLGRSPTETELAIVSAEWSEHCSYKSSKKHLGMLPSSGSRVICEKGFDSGVLDVGGGYVVTVHIESHNHPSAVEPYGGAATGVGGVIRDILSAGTRPIAILDSLRFGTLDEEHARWLFKGAVSGIADYGNCIGIPTVGGEAEFDSSYSGYAMVDVAAIGFGKKERLIRNGASDGDAVMLLGGPTGRDGIGGAQFASDALETEDRSAVQIPDPFIEKMIIEAVLEARDEGIIRAMKDLGGGGLSCAISETADALGVGIELDINKVHTREPGMSAKEIMTSESQERMLLIVSPDDAQKLSLICAKYGIDCSAIGSVHNDDMMRVANGDAELACAPAKLIANAPLLSREYSRPTYMDEFKGDDHIRCPDDIADIIYKLLSSPNISSKKWVYNQYDYEVGIRTVAKPGRDAAVLRLDNGKFLAIKLDGNPKHCHIEPREGAAGCFEEGCRNIACMGARPIGMVDHLQFGSPKDSGVFWTFMEALHGITGYGEYAGIPCVGGKVSFYNETPRGPIKPTPVIGVLGLADAPPPGDASRNDALVMIGQTRNEMGGSEYMEYIHGFTGGAVPRVDNVQSVKNMKAIISAIEKNLPSSAHDCAKGGLAIAICEMCISAKTGCTVNLDDMPGRPQGIDRALFSESHSRYLFAVNPGKLGDLKAHLSEAGVPYCILGIFGGDQITLGGARISVDKAQKAWSGALREALI